VIFQASQSDDEQTAKVNKVATKKSVEKTKAYENEVNENLLPLRGWDSWGAGGPLRNAGGRHGA
jgi:hypothetical protein